MFGMALRGETPSKLPKASLWRARLITFICWNMFTLIWYIQRSEIVTYEVGEVMFCINDMFAKPILTLILVEANVEEATNERIELISEISSNMENQMAESLPDKLLAKLLPPSLVNQLKTGKSTGAEEFASVTVFFSDIPNFPAIAAESTVANQLKTLDNLWKEYAALAQKWGVVQVETIGDVFLAVCGAPDRVADHAVRMVNFALDIVEMVPTFRTVEGLDVQVKIGLNSGPITAGILGESNPHWCIVGDTVNTASRMESTSKPFQIHISESTYALIKNKRFKINGPETMNIKGKGQMSTYWVVGRERD
ncbi:nucleotide cyclase [Cladochytrium replicatum]|nr:nucleotide cyclase [Cladochytrium replicatum]